MALFRKAAVAVVALSALALTSTAASAHALTGSTNEESEESSMSWGYYRGPVIDFTETKPDVFKGASATAIMLGVNGSSFFRVQVTGIDESAIRDAKYGAHLHEGPCVAEHWDQSLGHYNADKMNGAEKPLISKKTEVWLDFGVSSDAIVKTTASVPFVPKPDERSIVFHALPTNPDDGKAGDRLACLPFKIKVYGN